MMRHWCFILLFNWAQFQDLEFVLLDGRVWKLSFLNCWLDLSAAGTLRHTLARKIILERKLYSES